MAEGSETTDGDAGDGQTTDTPTTGDLEQLHKGKAKTVYDLGDGRVLISYRDDATAFDAEKKAEIEGKGRANCLISAALFEYLEEQGVPTHFVELRGDTEMVCEKVDIIPLEVIVRNIATGSLVREYPFEEGTDLVPPLVMFDLKADEFHDPLVNRDMIRHLELATDAEVEEVREQALAVNEALVKFFEQVGILVPDFKLEFGRTDDGRLVLADEVSPDTCRFWDAETRESLDKDRFRFDKGDWQKGYRTILDLVKKASG